MTGWCEALGAFADAAADTGAQWMLVGSAASAVHGVPLVPNDVDISARAGDDVAALAKVLTPVASTEGPDLDPRTFLSTPSQPVVTFGDDTWTFGRWLMGGTKVEIASIASGGGQLLETTGADIWNHRQFVD